MLRKLLGTQNERELRRLSQIVLRINALEPGMMRKSDAELREMTDKFKARLADGESLDGLMIEAFAVVREAARRTVKMRPFDVQIMGAIVLHEGKIAEMATGEGKTLVATMPLYLNALTGKGVHLVTVNDYLARRDRHWMGPIYEFLGMTVGVLQHDMRPEERKRAYECDITYGTNSEFGFDYLRDNMVVRAGDKVQRGHHYAIVDEVDSILIDEARTPLIISGPAEESTEIYYAIDKVVRKLKKDVDYEVDEKAHTVTLTDEGVRKAEKLLGVENLFDPRYIQLVHHINQALRAHELFHRDVDYVVKDGQVIIVDEFTGRLMPGRRWSDGLHQAVEAKEGVRIQQENQTLATITLQNYFRMYEKLAGMTGTAATEAQEFKEIYGLDVVVIPTNRPLRRISYPDVVYKTEQEKFEAVVKEIEELHREGRPVLVGTISIEKSERLSRMLKKRGIKHHVLNAKYHELEAQIVAQAGQPCAVTIATNMAGRGTDIVLGEGVAEKGGLHIIGTERHEARRIDNQLRGRAGRQGDPGSSRFYLSLEDDLLRIFAGDRIKMLMEKLGWKKGEPLEHPWLTRTIENAQRRVEAHNFEIRKRLLEYDNVMNKQREIIYQLRDQVLEDEDLRELVFEMIEDVVDWGVDEFTPNDVHPEEWDMAGLREWAQRTFGIDIDIKPGEYKRAEDIKEIVIKEAVEAYKKKVEDVGEDVMGHLERVIMLQIIDTKWKDHLYAMDHLREGIHYQAYAQKDPLIEYQHEGFMMFAEMMRRIKEDVVNYLFRVQVIPEGVPVAPQEVYKNQQESAGGLQPFRIPAHVPGVAGEPAMVGGGYESTSTDAFSPTQPPAPSQARARRTAPGGKQMPYRREHPKIGRNDPCPCGSGKKYKKCCGKNK